MDDVDDQRLAELLARATEEPSPVLRERVRHAVEHEVGLPERRAWKWGVAAAGIAAAIALIATVAVLGGDRQVRTGPADAGDGTHWWPQQWPEGLDGETHVVELSDDVPLSLPPAATFLVGNQRAAFATIVGSGPGSTDLSGTSGVESLPDGRQAETVTDEHGSWAFVDVGDGRAVQLRSSTPAAELAPVAAAFTDDSGRPDKAMLPDGWAWAKDPPAAAQLAVGTTPERLNGWWMASRAAPSPSGLGRRVQVIMGPAGDPELVMSQVRELTVGFSEQIDLDGRPGVLVSLNAAPDVQSVVSSPGDTTIAVVTGTEVTPAELAAVASSLEPVSDEEWDAATVASRPGFTVKDVPERFDAVAAPSGAGEQDWGLDCCGTDEPVTVLSPSGRSDDPDVVVVSAVGFHSGGERGTEGGLHQSSAGYMSGSVAFEHEGAEAYFTPHGTIAGRTRWADLLIATGEGAAVRVAGPERSFEELLEVFAAVEPVTRRTARAPVVSDPPLRLQRVGSVDADLVVALGAGSAAVHQPPSATSRLWRSTGSDPAEELLVSTFPAELGDLEAILALRLPDLTLSRTDAQGRPGLLVESRHMDTWKMRAVWTALPSGDLLAVTATGDVLPGSEELARIAASVRQDGG